MQSVGTYRYDSLGRRVGKTSEIRGQTEHKHFLWQGLRMLREETPWQSSLYIYEPGSYAPLARVDQSEGEAEQTLYYFHTDQIGTPLEMTDVDGQIVWQATYKAWGELQSLAVSKICGFRVSTSTMRRACTTTRSGITIRGLGGSLRRIRSACWAG